MNILRKIYYFGSPRWRLVLRRIFYFPADVVQAIKGRDPLTPRLGDIYVGSGDFREQGRRIVGLMRRYAGLKSDASVLDVGSGIGRVAVALTEYLSANARYEGFDVVKKGVDWCESHITVRFPNFHFRYIPLRNELYNTDDDASVAAKFKFPYGDAEFDNVVLTSVFTHMVPDDVRNYFHEISRVLRPGGKMMATFFIVDEDLLHRHDGQNAYFDFKKQHEDGSYYLTDRCKEANVAYTPAMIEEYAREAGLTIDTFERGSWTELPGTKDAPDFQDLMVFCK